jgi:hypothetical protein
MDTRATAAEWGFRQRSLDGQQPISVGIGIRTGMGMETNCYSTGRSSCCGCAVRAFYHSVCWCSDGAADVVAAVRGLPGMERGMCLLVEWETAGALSF